jgi:dihydroorotate dehydrogenase
VDDYVSCLRTVAGVADYVAVNISSPNTESLRELQDRRRLAPLLTALLAERASLASSRVRPLPVLLKISPDLRPEQLVDVAELVRHVGIDGVIATNTTVRRSGIVDDVANERGGLSGTPLRPIAVRTVAALRSALGPEFPIIGVGGIDSVSAALAMRAAGADLVQLYTGLIYRGPSLVSRCVRALQGDA